MKTLRQITENYLKNVPPLHRQKVRMQFRNEEEAYFARIGFDSTYRISRKQQNGETQKEFLSRQWTS